MTPKRCSVKVTRMTWNGSRCESRVDYRRDHAGEPAEGANDLQSHSMDSRTVRWGFLYNVYPTRPSAKPNEQPLPGKLAGDDDRRLMAREPPVVDGG